LQVGVLERLDAPGSRRRSRRRGGGIGVMAGEHWGEDGIFAHGHGSGSVVGKRDHQERSPSDTLKQGE